MTARKEAHYRLFNFNPNAIPHFMSPKAFIALLRVVLFLPFYLVLLLLRPFLRIRFFHLRTDRIGHLISDAELFSLHRRNSSIQDIVLCFFSAEDIANPYVLKLFSPHLTPYISSTFFARHLFAFLNSSPLYRSLIYKLPSGSRDTSRLRSTTGPIVNIPVSHQRNLELHLRKSLGHSSTDKIALLMIRDSAYLKSAFPLVDFTYHSYRDSDISSYVLTAKHLIDLGYLVIRMGSLAEKPFPFEHPMLFDYAFSSLRSPSMDLYLSFKSSFGISTATGMDYMLALFRKPICWVNVAPILMFGSFYDPSLTLFKSHYLRGSDIPMTLADIFEHQAESMLTTHQFSDKNIHLVSNTDRSILHATQELLALISSNWSTESYDSQKLKQRFKQLLSPTQSTMHSPIMKAHISTISCWELLGAQEVQNK